MKDDALAFSHTAPDDRGDLSFAGGGSKALNFLTVSDQVLTLHLNGYGLGPCGWLISSATFQKVRALAPRSATIRLDEDGICFGTWRLNKGRNGRSLSLRTNGCPSLPRLYRFMLSRDQETGLYGPLSRLALENPNHRFEFIRQQLSLWMAHRTPDWTAFIGKGPGLTPSHDDMLVGMMFAASLFPSLQPRVRALLPETLNLAELTTSVSAGYLEQAREGYFSEPLLELQPDECGDFSHRAALFLNHGHYSGADTLLGIWIFLSFLFQDRPELFK